MIIVDDALQAREKEGRPIRVALLGAGFMSQGLANHIVHTKPGMRLVGVLQSACPARLRPLPIRRHHRRRRTRNATGS